VLDVDQYLLPKPGDIFATLACGKSFTTLDLSHAYNQMMLEEDSQKFAINTSQEIILIRIHEDSQKFVTSQGLY